MVFKIARWTSDCLASTPRSSFSASWGCETRSAAFVPSIAYALIFASQRTTPLSQSRTIRQARSASTSCAWAKLHVVRCDPWTVPSIHCRW